jgi:hypothetical protein
MYSSWFSSWARPTIRYCEPNLNGWVVQPANAVSSLLISLAGVYIIGRKRHAYSVYLGIVAIILGLASFFYYASFTFVGQLADLGSMYLLASLLIIVALRRYKFSKRLLACLALFTTACLIVITASVKTIHGFNIGVPLFGLLLLAAIYLELRVAAIEKLNLKFFTLTFVAFALGYIFWWLDYKKVWCSTSSSHYINGHALWHLFNAAALLALDKYYSQIKAELDSGA